MWRSSLLEALLEIFVYFKKRISCTVYGNILIFMGNLDESPVE